MSVTHIAAGQVSGSSSTDHAVGDQAAPPVGPVAGGLSHHREEGLLQDVSDGTSSFTQEQGIHSQDHFIQGKVSCNIHLKRLLILNQVFSWIITFFQDEQLIDYVCLLWPKL